MDVAYDWDLEGFMAVMHYNDKYKSVNRVLKSQIEEKSYIQDSQVDTILNIYNNLRLQREKI